MHKIIFLVCLLFSQTSFGSFGLINGDRIPVSEKILQHAVVTVGTSAVELKGGATRDSYRKFIIIYNDSSNTIYIGGAGVTATGATKGIPILKSQMATIPLGDMALYAIAESAGNSIIVMEAG
jgi:hypothetical protein